MAEFGHHSEGGRGHRHALHLHGATDVRWLLPVIGALREIFIQTHVICSIGDTVALCSDKESWLVGARSGHLCLECCSCDLDIYKQQKIHRWINRWFW